MDAKTIDAYNQMAQKYDEETSDFWEKFPRTFLDEFAQRVAHGKILDVAHADQFVWAVEHESTHSIDAEKQTAKAVDEAVKFLEEIFKT